MAPGSRIVTEATEGLVVSSELGSTKVFHLHDCAATSEATGLALTGRALGDRLGLDYGSETQSSISWSSLPCHEVCGYVHLNPVRAGLLGPEQSLQSYPWSSYPLYLEAAAKRPVWLRVDRLLGEWGIPKDSPAGREEFATRMEVRHRAERAGEYEAKGWCLGSEEFRQELLAQVSELATPQDGGEAVRQSAFAKAQRITQEELEALGWAARDLQGRRKSDAQKVRIATRLLRETTMTLECIANRLCMGSPTHVASLLQRHNHDQQARNSGETLTPIRFQRFSKIERAITIHNGSQP